MVINIFVLLDILKEILSVIHITYNKDDIEILTNKIDKALDLIEKIERSIDETSI